MGEQQKELKGEAERASSLEEVHSRRPPRWKRPYARDRDSSTKTCTRCGKGPHLRDRCPATEATCHRCNKKGHYSSQCFSKQVSEVTTEDLLETAFLDSCTTDQTSAWFVTVKLNERELKFKLDTEAEVSAISAEVHKSLQKHQLSTPEKVLYGPARQPLKTLGQFWGTLSHKANVVKQRVFVVD